MVKYWKVLKTRNCRLLGTLIDRVDGWVDGWMDGWMDVCGVCARVCVCAWI
jgi:hypothetical protein